MEDSMKLNIVLIRKWKVTPLHDVSLENSVAFSWDTPIIVILGFSFLLRNEEGMT